MSGELGVFTLSAQKNIQGTVGSQVMVGGESKVIGPFARVGLESQEGISKWYVTTLGYLGKEGGTAAFGERHAPPGAELTNLRTYRGGMSFSGFDIARYAAGLNWDGLDYEEIR